MSRKHLAALAGICLVVAPLSEAKVQKAAARAASNKSAPASTKKTSHPSSTATRTTVRKSGSAPSKAAPPNRGGVHSAAKGKPASSTKSHSRVAAVSHPRPAAPVRQSGPSPERYREIQEALAAKGYYTGPANGVWDAESVAALKRFQTDQNLAPDGKIGALSLIALGLGPKRDSLTQSIGKPELGKPEQAEPQTGTAR